MKDLPSSGPSFWEVSAQQYEADVLIIGGGITGVSTAIEIATRRPGDRIIVLEALPIGNLASTRNAGFACFGTVGEIRDDLQHLPRSEVESLLAMRYEGLMLLKERLSQNDIVWSGGMEVFRSSDSSAGECLAAIPDINDLVKQATGLKDTFATREQAFDSAAFLPLGSFNQYEGKLNPVTMMSRLRSQATQLGVCFYAGCRVTHIDQDRHVVLAAGREWSYQQLAICNNALAQQWLPQIDVLPAPNVVGYCQLKEGQRLPPMQPCYHLERGYFYWRTASSNTLLVGGGRHLIDPSQTPARQIESMKAVLNILLKDLVQDRSRTFDAFWHGYLGVGAVRSPICGGGDRDLYYAVRLGGMGVAIGSYLGRKLADYITS